MNRIYTETQQHLTTPYGNPQHFWTWFKDNHHMTINNPSGHSLKEFMDWFKIHLGYYCKALYYEVSFGDHENEFIFSAAGNPDHFEALNTLVDAAPQPPKTTIMAFHLPCITDQDIVLGNSKLKAENFSIYSHQLRFTIDYTCSDTKRKGITIYSDQVSKILDQQELANHVVFFLTDYLGEVEFFNHIASVDVDQLYLKEATKPILDLKQTLGI
jgi:hypothetical protein